MGIRLHRSIKVAPGVRLNFSKSGVGVSAGPRGLKVGVDATGHKYVSAGIPGTGLSSRHYVKLGGQAPTVPAVPVVLPARTITLGGGHPLRWIIFGAAAVVGILAFFLSHPMLPDCQ
jgi:Protein of unknown function (DUF4236)